MNMAGILISKLFVFFALAVPGFFLGRGRLFDEKAVSSISNLLLYVAMPSTVFLALVESSSSEISIQEALLLLLFSVGGVLVFSWLCHRHFFAKLPLKARGTYVFCSVFSNCGFLGIPLVDFLYPNSPKTVLFVSLFNVASSFLLWTLGVFLLSRDRKDVSLKKALGNPLFFSVLFGLLFSFFPCDNVKNAVWEFASLLSSLTAPLSMSVLGFLISQASLKGLFREPWIWIAVIIKLIALPCFVLVIPFLLRAWGVPLGAPFCLGLFFASGVSTAATAPVLAERYRSDGKTATALTVLSTLFSIVTLPLLYPIVNLLIEWTSSIGGIV